MSRPPTEPRPGPACDRRRRARAEQGRCATSTTSMLTPAPGSAVTNGAPWLLAGPTTWPSERTLNSGSRPSATRRSVRIDARRRVGAVDEVLDLARRVADLLERLGHRDRVADRRRVVGHDLEDGVGLVEQGERQLVQPDARVDDHEVVQPAHQRERLLEVADQDHLGHLDARRGEQDVDVAPARARAPRRDPISEMRSVGRSSIDGASRGRPQEAAQVAELDAAVDERRSKAEARRGDAEVERDRGLADAALRREDDDEPARALLGRRRGGLVDVGDAGDQVVAVERHREDLVDALVGIDVDRVLGHRQHDDGHADLRRRAAASRAACREAGPGGGRRRRPRRGRCSAIRSTTERSVGHDVDEPHLTLGVQQPSDVLRDLGYVLDEEQANLIGRCHRRNGTTGNRRSGPAQADRGLRAKSTARSLPGDIAPSS